MSDRGWSPWVTGLAVGACVGSLAFVLVVRLNPEVALAPMGLGIGALMWTTWGAVGAGLPIALLVWSTRRLRRLTPEEARWRVPAWTAAAYVVAAVLSRVNADLHPEYLSGSGHRVLAQDAVGWLIGALLALSAGVLVRRAGSTRALRVAFTVVFTLLPLVRLFGQPTPPQSPARDRPRPLGTPERALVVVAVEGLDSELLIDGAAQPSTPTLGELIESGSWGPLDPFEPYLRWSLWTTLATGTEPGLHGVKAHRAWRLSPVFDGVLRLLPWTPQGSRHILPWWAADMVRPPSSGVPALWARLRASGAATTVLEWPGVWPEEDEPETVRSEEGVPDALTTAVEADIEEALAAFPDQRPPVLAALRRDRITVARAVEALRAGSDNLWVNLGAVLAVRENLEPLRPTHTRERRLRHLMMELVDTRVRQLLSAAPQDRLLVVVSPYGVSPPDVWERWRRLIGSGGDWRTSPLGCPDGVLLLAGRGVRPGHRVPEASITDVAPTVCYLLGLPIVQSMDGRVILDAVQPAWVESHPLRVVN